MNPNTVTNGQVGTPGLTPGQPGHCGPPPIEASFRVAAALEIVVEAMREDPGTARCAYRIAQRHLLERKQQVGSGLDTDGKLCGLPLPPTA